MDAGFDGDQFCAALDDKARVEAITLVHLERQPAEVAETLLAYLEQ